MSITCSNCGHFTEDSDISGVDSIKVKQLKKSARTPKYMFVGLLGILLLAGYIGFSESSPSYREPEYYPSSTYDFYSPSNTAKPMDKLAYANIQSDDEKDRLVTHPEIGDVYVIWDRQVNIDQNHYFVIVREILYESLTVSISSSYYVEGTTVLHETGGFYDITFEMDRQTITDLLQTGELRVVFRDYPESSGFVRTIKFEM